MFLLRETRSFLPLQWKLNLWSISGYRLDASHEVLKWIKHVLTKWSQFRTPTRSVTLVIDGNWLSLISLPRLAEGHPSSTALTRRAWITRELFIFSAGVTVAYAWTVIVWAGAINMMIVQLFWLQGCTSRLDDLMDSLCRFALSFIANANGSETFQWKQLFSASQQHLWQDCGTHVFFRSLTLTLSSN